MKVVVLEGSRSDLEIGEKTRRRPIDLGPPGPVAAASAPCPSPTVDRAAQARGISSSIGISGPPVTLSGALGPKATHPGIPVPRNRGPGLANPRNVVQAVSGVPVAGAGSKAAENPASFATEILARTPAELRIGLERSSSKWRLESLPSVRSGT